MLPRSIHGKAPCGLVGFQEQPVRRAGDRYNRDIWPSNDWIVELITARPNWNDRLMFHCL
jgi:hypothetical protein